MHLSTLLYNPLHSTYTWLLLIIVHSMWCLRFVKHLRIHIIFILLPRYVRRYKNESCVLAMWPDDCKHSCKHVHTCLQECLQKSTQLSECVCVQVNKLIITVLCWWSYDTSITIYLEQFFCLGWLFRVWCFLWWLCVWKVAIKMIMTSTLGKTPFSLSQVLKWCLFLLNTVPMDVSML